MKNATKKKLIYIRYVLPPIIMLLIPLLMLIPSYEYVVDGDYRGGVSAWSLIGDSFSSSRQILFGSGEHTLADTSFAQTMLILVLAFVLLYLIAFAASVYCSVVSMKYFFGRDEEKAERSRTLFVTFFPNRICITIAELLVLPLMLLPYFMPSLFESAYYLEDMDVTLLFAGPDALMIGGVLLLGIIALSVICAPMERQFGADVFKKRESFAAEDEEMQTEEIEAAPASKVDDEAREEINRRIRELLKKNDDD